MATDPHLVTPAGSPRARSLGIAFEGRAGAWNSITDVPGVEVGYITLQQGSDVRTGVTGIHPRGRGDRGDPCAAGVHSHNGNGEMTGFAWVQESGTTSGPIAITNTNSIGAAHEGIVRWIVANHPDADDTWFLPVAAETWDGWLNDVAGLHVRPDDVVEALDNARSGPIDEGSVGGGTGMTAFGYKAGSGTASRMVACGSESYTVGVFVQANFGRRGELVVRGVPVGLDLLEDDPLGASAAIPPGAGSIIGIVVTDAPLLPVQCAALARRIPIGVARTGTSFSHFSGDLFLALSVGNALAFTPGPLGRTSPGLDSLRFVRWGAMDPMFAAVASATEEAILDAMVASDETIGFRGHRVPGFPRDRVVDLLRAAGRI